MAIIYAIPGFGCTKLLFERPDFSPHTLKVPDWPKPEKDYTLKQYAEQFLPQIDTSQPYYLLGVSFGGMLCVELGEMLSPEGIILISSAKNKYELPFPIRLLKYFPVHIFISEKMMKRLALMFRRIIGFQKSLKPLFMQMMDSMPPGFFYYCLDYIACWDRKTNTKPISHIHGNADYLLWYRNIKQLQYPVEGGTHAMIVNRPREINLILKKIIPG